MLRVKSPQDLGAGLLFLFIGCVGLYFGKDLTYGSARTMGPGYFPIWLSWIINGMGVICVVRSLILDGEEIGRIPFKPILWVSVGVLLFGYLMEYVKLELALLVITIVATQSRRSTDLSQKIIALFALVFGVAILSKYAGWLSVLKPLGETVLDLSPWLAVAMFVIYALLSWSDRDARQTMILAVSMAIAAVLIFVVILGQAMPTWTADYMTAFFSKIGSIFTGSAGR